MPSYAVANALSLAHICSVTTQKNRKKRVLVGGLLVVSLMLSPSKSAKWRGIAHFMLYPGQRVVVRDTAF